MAPGSSREDARWGSGSGDRKKQMLSGAVSEARSLDRGDRSALILKVTRWL